MTVSSPCRAVVHFSCLKKQYRFYRTAMTSLLVPPVSVRGMTCLDRDAFTTTVTVPFLKLRGTIITTYTKHAHIFKKYMLRLPNFKPVQKDTDGIMVYLNPLIIKKFDDITENDRNSLAIVWECFGTADITFNYENWVCNEILKAILPEKVKPPTSYSLVGHIVHLNLRDVHLPQKTIIGQVFLDKIACARTVVNKTSTIDTTYRYFNMEILAGEMNTITTVKEHGCMYKFDFAKVYWNSRLSTEHTNLISFMKPGDTLYDVCAGVGPFAIPAARKGVKVLANDLNPESCNSLKTNININKVKTNIKVFNKDGRDFLRCDVKNDILHRRAQDLDGTEHIVINLPELGIEFLDILPSWFTQAEQLDVCRKPPTIHLYCFVKANKNEDVCKLGKLIVEQKLGCTLYLDVLVNTHNVRDVAPNKDMVRVSFLLNKDIINSEGPAKKKFKAEDTDSSSI